MIIRQRRMISAECLPRLLILHYAQMFGIAKFTHENATRALTDEIYLADLSLDVLSKYQTRRKAGLKAQPDLEHAFNYMLELAAWETEQLCRERN